MPNERLRGSTGPLARLLQTGTVAGLGERQLLARFLDHDDHAAFEAIVVRHGPMVLGVCRRRLRDSNDVEDAFQATFLILVRKARSLRNRDALGPWLHGVARRVASRARSDAERRWSKMQPLHVSAEVEEAQVRGECCDALDEEIDRLPETFRMPIVLCHLEGCSYEEAAQRLNWTEGMVRGRLARGRERLRERLSRRGLAPSDPVMLAPIMPPELVLATVRSVQGVSQEATVSTAVSTLGREVLKSMFYSKARALVTGFISIGLAASGVVMVRAQYPEARPVVAASHMVPTAGAPIDLDSVRNALQGWWEGLETLSFREETYFPGPDGRRDPAQSHTRLDFALASPSRFAYDLRSVGKDASQRLLLMKRWDEENLYLFHLADADSSEHFRFITRRRRDGSLNLYEGEMSMVLWLLRLSGGGHGAGPFHRAAQLEVVRDAQGMDRVWIRETGDRTIRAELDAERGWMPRKVTIDEGTVYNATRFRKLAGRWFPIAGTRVSTAPGKSPQSMAFEVTDLRINEPIPKSAFNLDDFREIRVQTEK